MIKEDAPEFKTASGDIVKAPNWPKGAPQINGPRTAEPSDHDDDQPKREQDTAKE